MSLDARIDVARKTGGLFGAVAAAILLCTIPVRIDAPGGKLMFTIAAAKDGSDGGDDSHGGGDDSSEHGGKGQGEQGDDNGGGNSGPGGGNSGKGSSQSGPGGTANDDSGSTFWQRIFGGRAPSKSAGDAAPPVFKGSSTAAGKPLTSEEETSIIKNKWR